MAKKLPSSKKRINSRAKEAPATPEELLEQAADILLSAYRPDMLPAPKVPWDFELGNDFRGPVALPDRAAAKSLVLKVADTYRKAVTREQEAEGLTRTLRKFAAIEKHADRLARAVKTLTVDEYRLLHIGGESSTAGADISNDFKSLQSSLFPANWQGAEGKRMPSGLSSQADRIARYFGQVRFALAQKFGFPASVPDSGGKTKSVHLLVGTARWRLVHIAWQTFAALPGLSPSGGGESVFHNFLRTVHEAVTSNSGDFSRELTGDAGHYVRLRRSFDEQEKILRLMGERYGWTNVQELEDVVLTRKRRPATPLTHMFRSSVQEQIEQYRRKRTMLLRGPEAPAED